LNRKVFNFITNKCSFPYKPIFIEKSSKQAYLNRNFWLESYPFYQSFIPWWSAKCSIPD